MSGSLVIWHLLTHNAAYTAIVLPARIKRGYQNVVVGTALPLTEITRVDRNPRRTVAMSEGRRLHVERVQVMQYVKRSEATPPGSGVVGVDALHALALAACSNRRATIAGVDVLSILPDQVGPDLGDVEAGFEASAQDFIVTWRESA